MATVTATSTTRFVSSADGTRIAYDISGSGPAVVVVEGALCQRSMGTAQALRPLLSEHYCVYAYDRRGRGESGPGSSPYAVQREVEDLAAVLEAARAGVRMRKVALYEVPFIVDDTHAPNDPELGRRTQDLVDGRRRADAVKLASESAGYHAPQWHGDGRLAPLLTLPSAAWRK
jgi:hypothetical protein